MSPRMRQTLIAALLIIATAIAAWQRSTAPRQTPPAPPSANEQTAPARTIVEAADLERSESLGGHTLRKHAGRSDAELAQRLERETNISAASTYSDKVAAQQAVSAAIAENAARVEEWLASAAPGNTLTLHYHGREVIGRGMERGQTEAFDRTGAIVVLRKSEDSGYFVLTSYPEQ